MTSDRALKTSVANGASTSQPTQASTGRVKRPLRYKINSGQQNFTVFQVRTKVEAPPETATRSQPPVVQRNSPSSSTREDSPKVTSRLGPPPARNFSELGAPKTGAGSRPTVFARLAEEEESREVSQPF